MINELEQLQNFQEDVGSWDKYGSEDYSTNYDISDILDD